MEDLHPSIDLGSVLQTLDSTSAERNRENISTVVIRDFK